MRKTAIETATIIPSIGQRHQKIPHTPTTTMNAGSSPKAIVSVNVS